MLPAKIESLREVEMGGRRSVPALLVLLTLAIGILIGTLISRGVRAAKPFSGAPGAAVLATPSPAQLSDSFARIAANVEPAVVNINTESTVRVTRRRFDENPDDAPPEDLFNHLFRPDSPGGDFRQQSLGSGIILDKNGYVMTNYHVITREAEDRPVDRIRVFLHGDNNPKGYLARVIGKDKSTDLAVIKIDAGRPLAKADFGDSEAMRVGDWVLAVGSPFGLEATVTAGIISAKNRNSRSEIEGGTDGQFKRFLQTDAAINPGNSGGPLVNLAGQVIGINTAIATRHGTSDGVGFAMPSNIARKVYNSIITTGSVQRGAIGIQFLNQTTPALLRSFGADHGVVVNSVEPRSPAEQAGLQRGDVITAIGNKPVGNGDDLVGIVSEMEIGKKLHVEYLRNNKKLSADVEVADRNRIISAATGAGQPAGNNHDPGEQAKGGCLGFAAHSLSQEQAQKIADKLRLSSSQGVVVTEMKPDGFAEEIGLQAGDIVLSINRQVIASVADFNRFQAALKPGQDVLLLVARPSQGTYATMFLADRLP